MCHHRNHTHKWQSEMKVFGKEGTATGKHGGTEFTSTSCH